MRSEISITAIVLAAGMSKRMGSANKLLMKIDGEMVLERSVRPIVEAGVRVLVVTGHESEKVESCLNGYRVEFVYNERYMEGMGTSLARGVASIGELMLEGIMVSLGDLPYLKRESVHSVLKAFSSEGGKRIVVPTFEGKPGHPIILPVRYGNELRRIHGDKGAKDIINRDWESVMKLDLPDKGIVLDFDSHDSRGVE